jgi:hypothetical protein
MGRQLSVVSCQKAECVYFSILKATSMGLEPTSMGFPDVAVGFSHRKQLSCVKGASYDRARLLTADP